MTSDSAITETHGSPYEVPSDTSSLDRLSRLINDEAEIRNRLTFVRDQLAGMNLLSGVRSVQVTREVFESNKIEGVGPDIGRTHSILSSDAYKQSTLDHAMFTNAVKNDQDLTDVLGLMGARRLAQKLSVGDERPITEMDIRTLHSWICSQESHAGMYKRFHVTIFGSNHEPHLPVDVPGAMSDLVKWLRHSSGSAILRASIAHAWLTHIHPFEDGNGRIARLLANIILRSGGLPPAIVKHASQRGPYLDALGQSDDGGDILPFAAVFRRSLRRYIKEVEQPEFLNNIFDRELENRGSSPFEWWSHEFQSLANILELELRPAGISVRSAGRLDNESFALLQRTDPTGNTWAYYIEDGQNRLLIWLGYVSTSMRTDAAPEEIFPSAYFSARQTNPNSYKPYRRLGAGEFGGLQELHILPGLPSVVYLRIAGRTIVESIDQAAARLAIICIRKLSEMTHEIVPETVQQPAWDAVFSTDH